MTENRPGRIVIFGTAFLLVGLVCAPPAPAGAQSQEAAHSAYPVQEQSSSPMDGAQVPEEGGVAPVPLPDEWADDEFVEAPRRVVAMLIRAALQSPDNHQAWTELAQALPELGDAREGEAYVRLLQAAQIADSVAVAAGTASGGPGQAEAGDPNPMDLTRILSDLSRGGGVAVERVVVWISGNDGILVLVLASLLIALILLKGREPWAPTRSRRTKKEERAGERLLREGTSMGMDAARALWSSGLPVHEIARRTGLAQDALSVMVSMQGRSEG